MKRMLAVLGGLALVALPAAHGARMGMMGADNVSVERHRYVMHNGIGPEYAGRVNPLSPTDGNLQAGGRTYEQYCLSCHGPSGRGDGPAAQGLTPPPGNIAAVVRMPMATDGYLYWTVAEGGVPLGTAMPPFGDVLSEREIWQLIVYLRTL